MYCIATMKECLNDAAEILDVDPMNLETQGDFIKVKQVQVKIATSLFKQRVSPFHYWKQNFNDDDGNGGSAKPASQKQKEYMADLGIEFDDDISMEDASKLIIKTQKDKK